MAVPRSKRKRLLILSGNLSARLIEMFDQNQEGPVYQEGLVYCAQVMPQMLLESDSNWTEAQTRVYNVVDSFATDIEDLNSEPDYETGVAALGSAVAEL